MHISSRRGALLLHIDPDTGLPIAMRLRSRTGEDVTTIILGVSVALDVGGIERRGATGGVHYSDADRLSTSRISGVPREVVTGLDELWEIDTLVGEWNVTWEWTFRTEDAPAVSLALRVSHPTGADPLLRNLILTVDCDFMDKPGWLVQAPGNMLRADVRLDDLPKSTGISPAGGLRGSTALVAFERPGISQLVVWPFCRSEVGSIDLEATELGARIVYQTDLSGDVPSATELRIEPLHLHLDRSNWEETRQNFDSWYRTIGVTTPNDPPHWVRPASIYEAQLGYSVFWGGHQYAPYPEIGSLVADLDRIQSLGFDTIQLMPRQPYPSYNVHDYADIGVSYAPEEALRDFVMNCHTRGMKVIVDVLLHGVLDQESIGLAADGVRSGPLADLLDQQTGDSFGTDPNDSSAYQIAWSRHIIDFEPHWTAGSPPHSPLLDAHPEWFFRDSSGAVAGVYTQAFDARSPGFQDYFIDAMLALVDRLDIDGFRFDAPTYNAFANWSPDTRHRASASVLACAALFRRLRAALKRKNPGLLMYTEPSGVVLRESMDLNYNYDEQWLITALMEPDAQKAAWTVASGHDLVGWLRDRDALLPRGAMTAHHIDSHDTFWWPLWGKKWRREQFGIGPTKALASLFILAGGPYMMFTGGEIGVEAVLIAANSVKSNYPAVGQGSSDFRVLAVENPAIFTVIRQFEGRFAVVAVNLSPDHVTAVMSLPSEPGNGWIDVLGLPGVPPAMILEPGIGLEMPGWSARVLVPTSEVTE